MLIYSAWDMPQLDQRINKVYWRFRVSLENGMSQEPRLAREKVSSWPKKLGDRIVRKDEQAGFKNQKQ